MAGWDDTFCPQYVSMDELGILVFLGRRGRTAETRSDRSICEYVEECISRQSERWERARYVLAPAPWP